MTRESARESGKRTNDQTRYRPRAIFLHVCFRHRDRDCGRKLAHLVASCSESTGAGNRGVVTTPVPNKANKALILRARKLRSPWPRCCVLARADVLADPRARTAMAGERLPKPFTVSWTSPGRSSRLHAVSVGGKQHSAAPICSTIWRHQIARSFKNDWDRCAVHYATQSARRGQ